MLTTRTTRSAMHRLRLVVLIATVLGLVSADFAWPAPTLAKEFDVVGTVDCGLPSGRRCSLDDVLVLLTDSVTGDNELVAIDIRGIRRKLPALDQDDEITLAVEILPDGTLKALSVISAKRREGTINQGKSTGTKEVSESRRDRGLAQDKDQNDVRPIGGGVSGTVINQLTGAPIPGVTVRLNGFTATTDGAGFFNILLNVPPAPYQIEASAPLFFTSTVPVLVQSAQTTQIIIPLQPQPSTLSGVVRSLVTGAPIPGATVRLNGLTATTTAAGAYVFAQVNAGTYQVEASAPGFITQILPATIQAAAPAQLDFALASAFPGLNFTLVWGAQPTDLDAHLSGPTTTPPTRFHAFWQSPNPVPFASLTTDTQIGFGPERIIVSPNPVQYVAGEYRFWVDNPNVGVAPNYTGSQARVIVNRDNVLLGIFDVTAATGDPNLRLWHVVNVQLDAAGNAVLQPVQQFSAGNDLTVLAPPYGTKPRR